MDKIINLIEIYDLEIILGLSISIAVILILFLIVIINMNKKIKNLSKEIDKTSNASMERDINSIKEEISQINIKDNKMKFKIDEMNERLQISISRIGILRYNAFEDSGSRLSFSIALLDNCNNGFILTSIYTNGDSVSYAKPVNDKKSDIPLSAEEMIALDRALKG